MAVDLAHERLRRLNKAMTLPTDGETPEERASQILVRTIAIREARTWTPPENYKAKREFISGGELKKQPAKLVWEVVKTLERTGNKNG